MPTPSRFSAEVILHASCVAVDGQGVLILGPSGSGKSALCLNLMAFGAVLVADDQTLVQRADEILIASSPKSIMGLVEARFVGLLHAKTCGPVPLTLAVDLDKIERERLPELHEVDIMGLKLPALYKVEDDYFPAAILQYLRGGRSVPQ